MTIMGKDSWYNIFMAVIVMMVILTLAVLACMFFGYATKDIHGQQFKSTNAVLLNGKPTNDPTIYKNMTLRMDSIVSVLDNINQRYPQEIDTAINKTNSWMGFGMTILTFVLMICGFWQYIRIKEDKEIQNRMLEQFEKSQEQMKKNQERTNIENQISVAMRTLGAINDPILMTGIDCQKKAVKHFLENITILLDKYQSCVEYKSLTIDDRLALSFFFEQIILNLRLCLTRVQPLYHSAKLNVKIIEVLKKLKDEDDKVKISNRVYPQNIKTIICEIRSFVNEL